MQISAIYRLMGGDGAPGDKNSLYNQARNMTRRKAVLDGEKQYDYRKHDVTDHGKRPDKKIFVPTGDKNPVTGEDILKPDFVPPDRAPLGIQQYIIRQKASFAAGNGIKLRPSDETSQAFNDVYRNWYAVKADFSLRTIAKWQMADTQVAVIFFGEPNAAQLKSLDEFNFKFMIVGPSEDGSTLEPIFDEYRRLVALGREYLDTDTGKTIYDLYIAPNPEVPGSRPIRRRYRDNGRTFDDVELPYPKLPVVYWEQERPECDIVEELIKSWEFGFNDFTTQTSYSADPILFGKGRTISMPAKGSAGKFVEGSEDADLKYVTPDNATDSRELQFKLYQKYVFFMCRAVVLDLDTMQSLTEVSGAALDRYLIDPYMEATDRQQGPWGIGVQRMVNWLLAAWKDLRDAQTDPTTIDVSFTKYRVEDTRETVEMLLMANGNQPLISQQASISEAGLADDPAVEFERIKQEASDRATDAPQTAAGPEAQTPAGEEGGGE